MYNNDKFLDLINALSLIIGMQNLQENREQSAHNDVHAENEAQAKYILLRLQDFLKNRTLCCAKY